jgi:hypothetical protein
MNNTTYIHTHGMINFTLWMSAGLSIILTTVLLGIGMAVLTVVSVGIPCVIINYTMTYREPIRKLRYMKREGKIAGVICVYSLIVFSFSSTMINVDYEKQVADLQGLVKVLNASGYDITLNADDVRTIIDLNQAIKGNIEMNEVLPGITLVADIENVAAFNDHAFALLDKMHSDVLNVAKQYNQQVAEETSMVKIELSSLSADNMISHLLFQKWISLLMLLLGSVIVYKSMQLTSKDFPNSCYSQS